MIVQCQSDVCGHADFVVDDNEEAWFTNNGLTWPPKYCVPCRIFKKSQPADTPLPKE